MYIRRGKKPYSFLSLFYFNSVTAEHNRDKPHKRDITFLCAPHSQQGRPFLCAQKAIVFMWKYWHKKVSEPQLSRGSEWYININLLVDIYPELSDLNSHAPDFGRGIFWTFGRDIWGHCCPPYIKMGRNQTVPSCPLSKVSGMFPVFQAFSGGFRRFPWCFRSKIIHIIPYFRKSKTSVSVDISILSEVSTGRGDMI